MAERWHSVDEISAHLGVATDTVYRWIAARRMPAHRVGRQWKFMIPEVDAWVRAGDAANDFHAATEERDSTWTDVTPTASQP